MKYQCYFDGSITINPGGDMTIGGLIYEVDEQKKEIVFEFTEKFYSYEFPNGTSNNVAEILALNKLLSFFIIEKITHKQIEIFGDSQIVINRMISRKRNGKGIFIPYINDGIDLLREFDDIKFQWIPREQNTEADLLTKYK